MSDATGAQRAGDPPGVTPGGDGPSAGSVAPEQGTSPPPGAGHQGENEPLDPSPERDELFCRIAARSGLLAVAQAQEVLAAVRGQAPGAAAALCLARGWLNAHQVRAVEASAGAAVDASPVAEGDGAREFGRLVELKRLAEDGRVDACRVIQQELSATPYARLGELLVQKAQRRAPAPEPRGIPGRAQAFDLYVKLKQAVQRGAVDEAARLAGALEGDPEFGRLARVQLERARTRRALADGRQSPPAAGVTLCHTCGASTRGPARCPRCSAGVADDQNSTKRISDLLPPDHP